LNPLPGNTIPWALGGRIDPVALPLDQSAELKKRKKLAAKKNQRVYF
jgi:hypothetical protein